MGRRLDKEERLELTLRISAILDKQCNGCRYQSSGLSSGYCYKQCPYGQELRLLGDELIQKNKKKSKADKMNAGETVADTKENFMKLKENDYKHSEVAEMMGLTMSQLQGRLRKWEINYRAIKRRKLEREYKLLRKEGHSMSEAANEMGIQATILKHYIDSYPEFSEY